MALLILGLPLGEPAHSRVGQEVGQKIGQEIGQEIDPEAGCAGLSRYTSQSYATDKGASRRCDLLTAIEHDGESLPGALRVRVLNELSNRFMLRIDFSGHVGLSRQAVDYLLDNMPEAAALVSAYSNKDYRATETDAPGYRDRFFVTNNETFAARFTYLATRPHPDASEHIFFESGFAKVLFWRVWGNSFIHYHLREIDEASSRYDIEVHVFTDSRLLRSVLSSSPFRYFATSMFDGILGDIEAAVQAFATDSNPGDTLPPYFVMGLKKRLQDSSDGYLPRERRIRDQYRELWR